MKYIVVDDKGNGYTLARWMKNDPLVLAYGTFRRGAHVFDTLRQAKAAIKRTLEFAEAKGWDWKSFGHKVVSIDVPKT